MIFSEYYTNTAKTQGRKGFQHHFNLSLLWYGIANVCIWSFFRVVCHFWTSDGSNSESYAKQKEKKKNIYGPLH